MNKDKQLKQTINKDGSLKVIKEEQYSFIVRFDGSKKMNDLLIKFNELGYSIDLEVYGSITPCFPRYLLRVDVNNKEVSYPQIVSVRHFEYLRDEASILISDVFDNFDEIVTKKNKELADSLKGTKKKNNNEIIK